MPNEIKTDYDGLLVAILNAIADGRIEAKTLRDMTPEQRAAYHEKLVGEEKDAISEGLSRHNKPDED